MRRLKTEMVRGCAPHILSRKWVIARVVSKAIELIHDVLR